MTCTARPRIECPRIPNLPLEASVHPPTRYEGAARLDLLQWWLGTGHRPEEDASAYVGWTTEGLCFYVRLEDSDIFTQARQDNEQLWARGDTVEFFLKPGTKREDYWEIHISPNGLIMDIYIPSREKLMSKIVSWEEVLAPESGTRKRIHTAPADALWSVECCVPWQAFGSGTAPEPGTVWQIAICRYNYTTGSEEPELSSTAHFSERGFHRYEDYHDLVFTG